MGCGVRAHHLKESGGCERVLLGVVAPQSAELVEQGRARGRYKTPSQHATELAGNGGDEEDMEG